MKIRNPRQSTVGVVFPDETTYPQWHGIFKALARDVSATRWQLGDAILHGQKFYGRRYVEAVRETNLDRDTIVNIASVCRRIEISRRREDLSFSHHVEVASLSPAEQDRLLEQAAAGRWTRAQLREAVAQLRTERPDVDQEEGPAYVLRIPVHDVPPRPVPPMTAIRSAADLQGAPKVVRLAVERMPLPEPARPPRPWQSFTEEEERVQALRAVIGVRERHGRVLSPAGIDRLRAVEHELEDSLRRLRAAKAEASAERQPADQLVR